jgi:CRP-like cAMP-binding protein
MRERLIGPGEFLFKEGECDTCLYYIRKGELELI